MAIKQDIYFAVDESVQTGYEGLGTLASPYKGGSSYVWIDSLLITLSNDPQFIPPHTTLRLGGGTFQTRGSNGSTDGWTVRHGWRLLGAGVNVTRLKLVGVAAGEHRSAIGMDFGGSALDGFEASDFTIDCGFPALSIPVNCAHTAVAVFGRHIRLKRLRVFNYGTNRTGTRIGVINAGSAGTEDAVVDECTIESGTTGAAPTGTSSALILILFGGQAANPHRSCVVRNCVLRGPTAATAGTDNPVQGICPGAALGFIAEHNQLFHLHSGVYDLDLRDVTPVVASESTGDVVIRNNYMRYVWCGINYGRSWPVSRLIIHDNFIDVARRPMISELPIGINLQWAVTNSNRYEAVILRENIIRSAKWDTGAPEPISGISVNQVTDLNIENNLINDATTGRAGRSIVLGPSVTHKKINNNRTSAGVLVRPDS